MLTSTCSAMAPPSGLLTDVAPYCVTRVAFEEYGPAISSAPTPLANSISSGNEWWTKIAMPT